MQPNLGPLDRSIRIKLALTALAIYSIDIVNSTANRLFIIIAFMVFFSAVIWNISTNEKKRNRLKNF